MANFVQPFEKPAYFEQALFLYKKYSKYLNDDFGVFDENYVSNFLQLIIRTSPYFWVIVEEDSVSGFVFLDNIIGDTKTSHSAELTTCFDKNFWGDYTKKCATAFLKFVFEVYKFEKIKALVFPDNFRVKTLLKYSGFEKEALLKGETIRGGDLQDIEIYSIFKERVKNENRNRKFITKYR